MTEAERTTEALARMFEARSIAVIGASNDPGKWGCMLLDALIRGGYDGGLYPVNRKENRVLGLTAYPSVGDAPGEVDLVVVAIPAQHVLGVLREAAEKGVAGAVVVSGGFLEAGRTDLEDELRSIVEETGLRILGPNIQGIIRTSNRLCAMPWPFITQQGPLAVISQSGTVTAAISEWAAKEGLGISAAVNLGNQVDLCEADLIEFFAADPHTKAIALYLEGVKDGQRFLETVQRAVVRKPIAVLKSGRTWRGQTAIASHTGSLGGSDEVFSAACQQYGVVRAADVESLYAAAQGLATLGTPKGNRVFAISTSGGSGALFADEADGQNLALPPLPDELVERLRALDLPAFATLANPLDLADVSARSFREVLPLVDEYDVADVYLLLLGDPVMGGAEVARELAGELSGTVAVCYYGGGQAEETDRVRMQEVGIPVFRTPESAARGIGAAVWAARRHQAVAGRRRQARVMNADPASAGSRYMLEPEAVRLIETYHIPYPEHGLARSSDEAVCLAEALGFPIVLKVVSQDVVHKSDVGGVVVGLEDATAVRCAYEGLLGRVQAAVPKADIQGVLVCKQAPEGLEAIVGALNDATFGPTVMFGLGGIFTEIVKDVSFRIAPLESRDAEEMIEEIQGYPLLTGARGEVAYDVSAVTEILLSVSQMIIDHPEIKELDLNPVRVYEQGLLVLDARVLQGLGQ
jgi:acyl-CoA synthetase (NDP forming)